MQQLSKMRDIVHEQKFVTGDVVVREGETGDYMYLLLAGEVEVSKTLTLMVGRGDLGQRDKSLSRMNADDCAAFGEMALLKYDSTRTATVKVLSNSILGLIHRDDFRRLCEADFELGFKVMKNIAVSLCSRLEKTNQDIMKLTTAFSLALQG